MWVLISTQIVLVLLIIFIMPVSREHLVILYFLATARLVILNRMVRSKLKRSLWKVKTYLKSTVVAVGHLM